MRNEIVVGLDDSPSSKAALSWAADHAEKIGAALRAVHALDWPIGLTAAGFPAPVDFMNLSHAELEDSYRQKYLTMFEAISPHLDWTLQFASGHAGRVLVRQSKDARLLVVGTHEHVGLGRLVASSVSHYCFSHATCPVVAVPPPGADHRAEASGTAGPAVTADTAQSEPGTALIVAGVDASAESVAAAHYAVTAAEMRGGQVVLLHAFLTPYQGDGEAGMREATTAAEKLLTSVTAQLIIPPQLQIQTRAEPGDPATILRASAQQAALLVLGRDHVSWGERLMMDAVASQLVSHVGCPLVVVPSGWRPRRASPLLPVILALDADTASEPALELAFEEARLRDSRLIVLHAEPMSASARDVAAARQRLGTLLSEWQHDHPEVAVSTVIVSGDADAQLIRWSRSAAVLIVGHPHSRGWGSWTKSVARSVMKQTHCPLIIAPRAAPTAQRGQTPSERALA